MLLNHILKPKEGDPLKYIPRITILIDHNPEKENIKYSRVLWSSIQFNQFTIATI